jgi:hypothetical protein
MNALELLVLTLLAKVADGRHAKGESDGPT